MRATATSLLRCALTTGLSAAVRLPLVARVQQPRLPHHVLSMSASTSPDVSKYFTQPRPDATKDYVMQQTMIRVKDPVKSLEFYCDVLGFNLVMYREFPQWGFNVYFVAQADPARIPQDPDEQWKFCMTTPGCIELTYNYGSEQASGPVYNTGNSDATGAQDGLPVKGGFGHLGITVPNVYAACERFQSMGCEFTKTPNSGGMKGLAFVKVRAAGRNLPHALARSLTQC